MGQMTQLDAKPVGYRKKLNWKQKAGQVFFDASLMPFYFGMLLYFSLYEPYHSYPPWTLAACFFRALPIFCLAGFVHFKDASWNKQQVQLKELRVSDNLAGYFLQGLLFSCLGDACLVFRTFLFLPGMLFFALAHVLYMLGLQQHCNRDLPAAADTPAKSPELVKDSVSSSEVQEQSKSPLKVPVFKANPNDPGDSFFRSLVIDDAEKFKSLYFLVAVATFMLLSPGIDSPVLLVAVVLYTAIIFSFAWMALKRWALEKSYAAWCGLVGSLLFLLSDFLIGLDKWRLSLPCTEFLVMTTYYSAQLCLAVSTTHLP